MAIEKWLGITSVALFAMFAGEMLSIYNFMTQPSDEFEFFNVISASTFVSESAESSVFRTASLKVIVILILMMI